MTENQIMYIRLFSLYFGTQNDNEKDNQIKDIPTDRKTGWY